MSDEINHDRRHFFGRAAVTLAAAQLSLSGTAAAQTAGQRKLNMAGFKVGANTSFASLKQIDAGLLSVGYAEAASPVVPPDVLPHPWPFHTRSFLSISPPLSSFMH